jgi:hypothetical protein
MNTQAQIALLFFKQYIHGPFAKKRKNDVLLLNAEKQPIAFINRRGMFGAARKLPNGRLWFSYPPQALEEQFMLHAVRYSEKRDVAKAAIEGLFPDEFTLN